MKKKCSPLLSCLEQLEKAIHLLFQPNGFISIGSLCNLPVPHSIVDTLNVVTYVVVSANIHLDMFLKVLVNAALIQYCLQNLSSFKKSIDTKQKIVTVANILVEGAKIANHVFKNHPPGLDEHPWASRMLDPLHARDIIVKLIDRYQDVIPSIVFDAVRKKSTELPYIFDDLIRFGDLHQVSAPYLKKAHALAQQRINELAESANHPK